MDQVQEKVEEDKAKAAAKVVDVNKDRDAKKSLTKASTSGTKPEEYAQRSGPLDQTQRAAAIEPASDQLEIPRYAKLLREAVLKKQSPQKSDLKLPLHCSEIIQKQRSVKQRDPDQFIVRCSIGNGKVDKVLCDLGASINIMPLEYYEKLNIGPLKSTDVCLRNG
ncbi:uncharacterized protein LOC121767065 [Salvia splendens]|uniref:uncharacterized protein LOC121767065 n=1 Tax=Salvia splendens TaxID=180675 RepID=UPI001C276D6E|nr:uncharacterized protein LOC121767065 [Salvia splendens]